MMGISLDKQHVKKHRESWVSCRDVWWETSGKLFNEIVTLIMGRASSSLEVFYSSNWHHFEASLSFILIG
eukprot:1141018-Pelagomonas_calceolata.AAC.10